MLNIVECVGLLAFSCSQCVLSYQSVICMVMPTTPMAQIKIKPNIMLRMSGQSWGEKQKQDIYSSCKLTAKL